MIFAERDVCWFDIFLIRSSSVLFWIETIYFLIGEATFTWSYKIFTVDPLINFLLLLVESYVSEFLLFNMFLFIWLTFELPWLSLVANFFLKFYFSSLVFFIIMLHISNWGVTVYWFKLILIFVLEFLSGLGDYDFWWF